MSVGTSTQSNIKSNGNHAAHGYQTAQNPATLEEIGKVPNTNLDTIPTVFQKARDAQKVWAQTKCSVRKKHILKMRDYIVDHAEELAEIVSKDNGKTRMDALATEVLPAALAADWYAKNAKHHLGPKKLPMSTFLFFNPIIPNRTLKMWFRNGNSSD